MLDFNHYNKLKEASIVPDHIKEFFYDDSESGKITIEMFMPAFRVAFYAATNELELFSDLLEKMKKAKKLAPYFHKRLLYMELYRSLGLLGDDCLAYLLSELDCSDSVFNGLHNSIINHEPDAFERVMEEWNGNFSPVTPMCSLLNLELLLNNWFEWIIKEANRIDEIKDLDQQNREGETLVRNSFDIFATMLKDVLNDELDDESNKTFDKTFNKYLEDTIRLTTEAINHDEALPISYKDAFVMGALSASPNAKIEDIKEVPESLSYELLLIAYHFLATETKISQPAKRVIKEILFTPEYETIWKQYEESGSIDYIQEEIDSIIKIQPAPQNEEPATEEKKDAPIPEKSGPIELAPTVKEGPLYPDSKYEFIPEDYFSQKIDKAHPLDHYNLVKEIQEKGVEQFFGFITYLVDEQYIENDNKQKALFAYRLTGRLRPKDDDLTSVWWGGKNNSPKELLYIVRYCVDPDSKKKFSKQMKDFFEGPDWPAKDYSRIADGADTVFRQALHAMYEVCGLKYNQPKKKKKKY